MLGGREPRAADADPALFTTTLRDLREVVTPREAASSRVSVRSLEELPHRHTHTHTQSRTTTYKSVRVWKLVIKF